MIDILKIWWFLSSEIKGYENECVWVEVTYVKYHTNDINKLSFPTTEPCS